MLMVKTRKSKSIVRPLLIGGKWITTETIAEIRAPYDDALVGRHYRGSAAEIACAIEAADRAFEKTRSIPTYQRAAILEKVRDGISDRFDEIVETCSKESGKPITYTRLEIERAVTTFDLASKYAMTFEGEILPADISRFGEKRVILVKRFPIGPIAAITPYNWPMNLVAHKVAPAMAVGNSVILRPSSQTPLTSLILGEIITETGYPEGGFNVVPCPAADAEALIVDPRIKMISFTGSPAVGWEIKARASKKRVALELGSNAAVILEPDTNLDFAVPRLVVGAFHYAGQNCISTQRIFVHHKIKKEFLKRFVAEVESKAIWGDPMREDVLIGPMINASEADRVMDWIQEAIKGGARALTGNKRHGNIIEATVLTDTTPEMRVNCREIFGPVVTIENYDSFDEALKRVNNSEYGIHAGIFTKDIDKAFQAFQQLEVGGVIINDYPTYRVDNLPYGGIKESGMGREGIKYTMEEMSELKHLTINLG